MSETDADPGAARSQGGIQSVDSALVLLRALAGAPAPASLTELSRLTGMPPSKAHRYLASFVHAGFAVQRGRSGRYDLGPAAAELGLAAMSRMDLVSAAAARLDEIVEATGAAALVAVWGSAGPTVVRWQRSGSFVVTSLGLGTVLPLLNSATGHVFAAWGPPRVIGPALRTELARAREAGLRWPSLEPSAESFAALAGRVRRSGYASVGGEFIPGLHAVGVPVLDWQGEAEAAITAFSIRPELADPEGPAVALLLRLGRELSAPPARDRPGQDESSR